MNSRISKTQTVTLSYFSLSHCTGSYTEFRLNKQLHSSQISWTDSEFRWLTDWNDERNHDTQFLWKTEPSIIVHEIWQVQPYDLFKKVSTIITASHNYEQKQILNILTEWKWASCDEAGEQHWDGNVQWMSGSIQFFFNPEVLHSHQY